MVLAIGGVSHAQTPTPTPSPSPVDTDAMPTLPVSDLPTRPLPGNERIGVTQDDPLSITLERAIEMALANNNDIEFSRKDSSIAEFGVKGALGIFDPFFNSQSFYESRTTPTASTIGGAVNGSVTQKQFFNDFGVTGFVPRFGGSYDVIFNSSRTNTTNRNATLDPQYPTSLIATFTQPLWRNRSIDNNRRLIEIARRNVEVSDSQLQLMAIGVVSNVERTYWDLVFALRNLQIQSEALRQAREQFESNRRLVGGQSIN